MSCLKNAKVPFTVKGPLAFSGSRRLRFAYWDRKRDTANLVGERGTAAVLTGTHNFNGEWLA